MRKFLTLTLAMLISVGWLGAQEFQMKKNTETKSKAKMEITKQDASEKIVKAEPVGIKAGKATFLAETFDTEIPATWTVENLGDATDAWVWNDGTARIDSDAAGSGFNCAGVLTSPTVDLTGTSVVYLSFDHYYRHMGSQYGDVEVFDGVEWVNVASYTASSDNMAYEEIDVSAYANDQFAVRFVFSDGGGWTWYWIVDNVSLVEPNLNDAALTAIVQPTAGMFENGTLSDVVVTLKNNGINNITALDIDYSIVDASAPDKLTGTFNWTGDLAASETEDVTIVTDHTFDTDGEFIITASINWAEDQDAENDVVEKNVIVYSEACTYEIYMVDAYSDGWDGTVLGLEQNGTLMGTFGDGFTSGETFGPAYIDLVDGIETNVVVVNLGSYTGEKGFTIVDPFGFTVHERVPGEGFTADDILFTFDAMCTLPDNDAYAVSVNMPYFSGTGFAANVAGTVMNFGNNENTFDVGIVIFDELDNNVFEAVETVTALPSTETALVSFGEWTPTEQGVYTVVMETLLATDENPANDVVEFEVVIADNLLWGQNIDVTESESGIVSTNYGAAENGLVETADDFILPAGQWYISSINPVGFQQTGALTGYMVKIYADNEGMPGEIVFEELVETTVEDEPVLTFAEPLILEGGHYWLMVAGNYPDAAALADGRWNWFIWNNIAENEAMLRDNPDFFGASATNWTALSALGVPGAGSTSFSIWGEEYNPVNLTVAVAPEGSGLVNGQAAWDIEVQSGTELTLTATPTTGYKFEEWSDAEGPVSLDAEYVFTITEATALTAYFVEATSATIAPETGTTELANPQDLTTVITWNDATAVTEVIAHFPPGDEVLTEDNEYEITDNGDGTADLTFFFSEMFAMKGEIDMLFTINYDIGYASTYTLTLDLGDLSVAEFVVTDQITEAPIEGATIEVYDDTETLVDPADDGVYLLEAGTYTYTVNMTNYQEATGTFDIADANIEVAVALDPVRADLTLTVNMLVWAQLEVFDPENDFVDVAGSFNDWGGEPVVLTEVADDPNMAYTATIADLPVGHTFEFKFRINGVWDDATAEFPYGGPARELTIVDGENNYEFWYNDDQPTTYTVTLTIVDADGALEGAVVTFDGADYTTDVDGIVTIADVADGTHAYSVAMDGYDTATGDIVVDGADVEQTITLTPAVATYTVTLTVVDADGAIEGATVTFDGVDYTTDVDGIVTITDVADGTYAYSVAMDAYDTATGDIVVDGADVEQTITITLTGINNGLLSNLKVYPNPFSSHITITNAEKVNRVVITNLIGQIVKDVTLNGTETISTSELANGIYLVTFEGINGERAVRKMVKQ
jgi:hypothetical protein